MLRNARCMSTLNSFALPLQSIMSHIKWSKEGRVNSNSQLVETPLGLILFADWLPNERSTLMCLPVSSLGWDINSDMLSFLHFITLLARLCMSHNRSFSPSLNFRTMFETNRYYRNHGVILALGVLRKPL